MAGSLFFYEEWLDRAAIDFHFSQSYSRHLSKMFQTWATSEVKINFHKVEEKKAQRTES
jgi:quinol monooxygenase YgiN